MLREDIEQYTKLTGEDGSRVPIIKLGAYLDGYNKGLEVQPEIIRCYQCKHAEVADSEDSQDGYTCQFHRGSIWFSGSYCSWAERRQDGD